MNISRKQFISLFGASVMLLLSGLWLAITRKTMNLYGNKEIVLNRSDLSEGVSFFEELIVIKQGTHLRFYSSACPHLGCRITGLQGNRITCPCHGSSFDPATGMPVNGPSLKPLQSLEFIADDNTRTVRVILP